MRPITRDIPRFSIPRVLNLSCQAFEHGIKLSPSSVRAPARESNFWDFKVQCPFMESNFFLRNLVRAPSLESNFCVIESRINKNIQYRHAMWIELRNWLQFGHDKTQSSATTNRRLGYLPSSSELAASIGYLPD